MKKILVISGLVLMVALFITISGCKDDDGMSKDSRIEAFVSDLNDSNRDGIFKKHFHSDSTSYSTGDESTVNAVFPNVSGGYSYSADSISGSGSTKTVVIDGGGDGGADGTFTFAMDEEDSDDWYIKSINPGGLN